MNIYLLSRCDKRKYLESLFYDGVLHFSYPINWIEEEKKKGIAGRGDLLEGVYSNVINPNTRRYRNEIEDVESKDKREKYLRSLSVVKWPCLCFYSASDLIDHHQDGDYIVFNMAEAYTEEFSDGEKWETRFETPFEERKAMVVIHRPDIFFKKVKNFFTSNGLIENADYFMMGIHYRKGESQFIYKKAPQELFYKDIKFKHQQEYRIVLNPESTKVKAMLEGSQEIKIGSLEDCAMLKSHFYKGARILVKGKDVRLEVKDWSNASCPLHEMELEPLLALIGIPFQNSTCSFGEPGEIGAIRLWEEIKRVLETKYRIIFDYKQLLNDQQHPVLHFSHFSEDTIKKNEVKDSYYYLRKFPNHYKAPFFEGVFVPSPTGIKKYTNLAYKLEGPVVPMFE